MGFFAAALIIRLPLKPPEFYQKSSPIRKMRFSLEHKSSNGAFQITEYESGKKIFVISARDSYLREKNEKCFGFRINLGREVELQSVEVVFFKDNTPVSYLNCQYAVIDLRKKDIIFYGNPTLITERNRGLRAQRITWSDMRKRLCAEGRCFLSREGKTRCAAIMNADVELKDLTMV
jgi:hypothetical protein